MKRLAHRQRYLYLPAFLLALLAAVATLPTINGLLALALLIGLAGFADTFITERNHQA